MTKSYCEKARIECPQLPQCLVECRYETTRKIKPYPAIPPDIEPVPDTWQTVGTVMISAVLGMIVICFSLVFFTGVWIWSLLI